MTSYSQQTWKNAAAALRMLCNERSMSFSSLKAGTMIEIFTGISSRNSTNVSLPKGTSNLGRRHTCRFGHRRVVGGTGLRAILVLGNNRPVSLDSFLELLTDVAGRLLRRGAGSEKKDRECQTDCAKPNHPN